MISVEEAYRIVLENSLNLGQEEIALDQCVHRVLAKDVKAQRDYPPFNRVAMDGVAIDYEEYRQGSRLFKVESIQAAGERQKQLASKTNCIEVMTGAVLPKGCTTVIPYEQVSKTKDSFRIPEEVKNHKNIHFQGSDLEEGRTILKSPFLIASGSTSILATEGIDLVSVMQIPKIAVVSTGDELVDIKSKPKSHQLRRSNSTMIAMALKKWGIQATEVHIDDDKNEIKENVASLLEQHDAVLFSGAVSKGKFDYLPKVLENLGVEKLFHKVAQRPGKPFWFGKNASTKVFAFPGNPISTWVCYQKYCIPWLKKSLQLPTDELYATLTNDLTFDKPLSLFQLVKESKPYGQLETIKNNGSGDLSSLAYATGMLELPATENRFNPEKKYNYYQF